LGREQEAWLAGELERSQADGTAWRVLGQQVMLGQMVPPGLPSHNDGWDGYRAARARLLRDLDRTNIRDVIALTGDYHSSWAMEITDDPFSDAAYDPVTGRGVRAVEFIAPAVSSSPLGSSPRLAGRFDGITETHPHVRLCDVEQNGYFMLDLDRERARADWFWQRTVREPGVDEVFGAAWATERGRPQLVAQAPSAVVG
jgi:alkaline phosphatase D